MRPQLCCLWLQVCPKTMRHFGGRMEEGEGCVRNQEVWCEEKKSSIVVKCQVDDVYASNPEPPEQEEKLSEQKQEDEMPLF